MLKRAYQKLVRSKNLQQDQCQIELISVLDHYQKKIENKIGVASESGILVALGHLISGKKNSSLQKQGVYIYGGVGRGKSMILQLFFETLVCSQKFYEHFHVLIAELYKLHAPVDAKRLSLGMGSMKREHSILKSRVLCLDELQINNIADAVALQELFAILFRRSGFVFLTSNFAPEELSRDEVNKDQFLPLINMLKNKLEVYNLDGEVDYRRRKGCFTQDLYYWPLDFDSDEKISIYLESVLAGKSLVKQVIAIDLNRSISITRSCNGIAVFSFSELCRLSLGTLDYFAICLRFHTIVICEIPQMKSEDYNEALRFIALIDCIYESKVKLICTAEVAIDNLYMGLKYKTEFIRTLSRLHEMQSLDYISQCRIK